MKLKKAILLFLIFFTFTNKVTITALQDPQRQQQTTTTPTIHSVIPRDVQNIQQPTTSGDVSWNNLSCWSQFKMILCGILILLGVGRRISPHSRILD